MSDAAPDDRKSREHRGQLFQRAIMCLVKSALTKLDELYDKAEPMNGDDLATAQLDLQAALDLNDYYEEH